MLNESLKADMKSAADKMKKLDGLNQIIIASKIDALFERQMIDEEKLLAGQQAGPRKAG